MAAGAPARVGVVGAGTMGAGIAQIAVLGGMDRLLHDPDPKWLHRGIDRATSAIEKGVRKGRGHRAFRSAPSLDVQRRSGRHLEQGPQSPGGAAIGAELTAQAAALARAGRPFPWQVAALAQPGQVTGDPPTVAEPLLELSRVAPSGIGKPSLGSARSSSRACAAAASAGGSERKRRARAAVRAISATAAMAAIPRTINAIGSSDDQGPPPESGSVNGAATVGITSPRRGITPSPAAVPPRTAASSLSCGPAGAADGVGSNATQPIPLK